jgi:acyl dehydratase
MKEFERLLEQRATYRARAPLGTASFDYFARAISDGAEIYVDDAAARAAGYAEAIAPPTFICETVQYSNRAPDENGYIGHNWELPIQGWQRVRGGNAYRFHQPVVASDILHVEWSVESVRDTTGAQGGRMVVVVSLAMYRNQRGELLAENRETMIYRKLR